VSTAAAATPAGLRRVPARRKRGNAALGAAVAAASAVLLLPQLAAEPVFVLVTAGVATATAVLGGSLLGDGERVSGTAFAAAGLLWLGLAVDAYPPWGPIVSWASTGLPAVALGVGLVHYRHRGPGPPSTRALVAVGLLLTVGARAVMAPFLDPVGLGFPPGAWWPAPWAGALAPVAAVEVSRATLLLLTAYVAVLAWRALHPPGAPRRRWPVLVAGLALAAGAAVVQVVSLALGGALDRHAAATATGVVALVVVTGLPVARALRRLFGAGSAHRLPRVRTPETVAAYLREITGDPTAELLYRAPDGGLLDAAGRRRSADEETGTGRTTRWVVGGDGERVALLSVRREPVTDRDAAREWVRAASVLADNVRPTVLLRSRFARLTALRVAEELAFTEERARLRRDLHDGLHQTIAAARMDLDGLHEADPAATDAVIAGLEAKMAVALAQVQSLGTPGAPVDLDAELGAAVELAAARLRVAARVEVSGARLGVLAQPVFLLVREALTNVARHARASAVDVRVHCDGRTVEIAVRDDGRGGAVPAADGGTGGMRRWVEELGGTVALDSPPGRGTTLRASIPCV
jgi:signal transduction histidine kinase